MLRKGITNLVKAVLCASMVMAFQVPTAALAAGSESSGGSSLETASEDTATVPQDYRRQSVTSLYAANQFTANDSAITMTADEQSESLLISGSKKKISNAVFTVSKDFNFSENSVGRFNFSGFAAAGAKVVLGFYLDDVTKPFVEKRMKCQEQESWSNPTEINEDILSLNIKGTHKLTIKVEEYVPSASSDYAFSLKFFEFAESSVPIVNIDIDEERGTIEDMNLSTHHTACCYGTVSIDVPEGYTSIMSGNEVEGTNGALDLEYIRGRGNSTWEEAKKPYKLKLDSAADLLGMGSNKHWALLANAYDDSLIHNALTSCICQDLGMDYTIKMEPVEVLMNGTYLGSYMLSEVVRVDESRVNIGTPEDTSDETLSGGYLLSVGDWTYDDDKVHFNTANQTIKDDTIQIESPELGDLSDKQLAYIKDYLQQVEDAIYSGGDYASLMDLNSAIKYFWIEEFALNGDGFTSGSCYLYKARNGKLTWGPVWDMDLAWGGNSGDARSAKSWLETSRFWNEKLFQDSSYVSLVQSAWDAYKAELEKAVCEGGIIDNLADHVRIASGYNFEELGVSYYSEDEPEQIDAFEYCDKQMSVLKTWINARVTWVDENLDTLTPQPTTVYFKDSDGNELSPAVSTFVGASLDDLPTPTKAGYIFEGWQHKVTKTLEDELDSLGMTEAEYRQHLIDDLDMTEEEADEEIASLKKGVEGQEDFVSGDCVVEDAKGEGMVLTAIFTPSDEIDNISGIYTPCDTFYGVYGQEEASFISVQYQTVPFDADQSKISFVSSNTNVVGNGSGGEGELHVMGPGDATVTIKPAKGVSKTVNVHIFTQEEYENLEIPGVDIELAKQSVTVAKGAYALIPCTGYDTQNAYLQTPKFVSSNEDVVEVANYGAIHALAAGTAVITCVDENGNISMCKVTVTDSALKVGSVVTRGKLKYEITAMGKTRTVKCIGAVNKKAKTVKVPNTVTIKSKKYKVRTIAKGAFKGMTKLKTVTLGSNLQIVGAKAFQGCKNLRKVVFKSKLKPKVYSSAFKGTKAKKVKYYVPRSQKTYYKIILKGKKVYSL